MTAASAQGGPFRASLMQMAGLSAVVATVLVAIWAFAGPVADASATGYFCGARWLKPYGQPGDRCSAELGTTRLDAARVLTQNTAGCVSSTDGGGNLNASWVCAPSNSLADIHFVHDGTFRVPIIRNNNTVSEGYFNGYRWDY